MKLLMIIILVLYTIIINTKNLLPSQNFSIVFPFTTIIQEDPNNTSFNLTMNNKIMQSVLLNDIYAKLELGYPLQQIYLRISVNNNDFFLSKENSIFEEKYPKKFGYFYYTDFKSSTFRYQTDDRGHLFFSHTHFSEYVQDDFVFYLSKKNDNKILIHNFPFLLAYKVNGPYHGIIGLKGDLIEEDIKRKDIFCSLKNSHLIKNYIWYLKYDKDNKQNGSLIIGNYPHYDDNIFEKGKNKYIAEKNFRKVYSLKNSKRRNEFWGLTFDNIYLKNITSLDYIYEEELNEKECRNMMLNPNLDVIIGSKYYKLRLERLFLNKYLNNKICFQPILRIKKNQEPKSFYYYYCNVSYIEKMKNEFMPIIFEHKEFQYNFTLNFEDLYIKKNNYIFLKIIFEENQNLDWVLGAPFLSKYLFIFNSDSKEIGFYTKNINSKIEISEKRAVNYFANVIKKFCICFILILIGIILGKKLFGLRRKLRANELEDKFEYKPADRQNQLF